jgi:putative SOS response-associated peptidase YedK
MCGRYTISHTTEEILERFNVLKEKFEKPLQANYNVAPSQMVPVVVPDPEAVGERILQKAQWGLVPYWIKDAKSIRPFINARGETVKSKAPFKQCLYSKRCIIPADGFYEWKKTEDGKKIPMRIHMPDDQLFGIAGIYDDFTNAEGKVTRTVAIITVAGNEVMEGIHDRMPAILTKDIEGLWLDPESHDLIALSNLLQPSQQPLEAYQVAPLVNKWSANSRECVLPVNTEESQLQLF